MIDKQEAAIFKSKQDFNQNKEKISENIKYAENWQVISVICSYTAMACDVLLIITMMQACRQCLQLSYKHQNLWYTINSSRSDR